MLSPGKETTRKVVQFRERRERAIFDRAMGTTVAPTITPLGHGLVAVGRLRKLLAELSHRDRESVIDELYGVLSVYIECPDGCNER